VLQVARKGIFAGSGELSFMSCPHPVLERVTLTGGPISATMSYFYEPLVSDVLNVWIGMQGRGSYQYQVQHNIMLL
jgi:hypothetical protein